ncbi:hypothetical protein L107_12510 [Cyanobium sp. Copco_Reservoir_LC18]|nr:hypothetical protein L107_12510 [Cyanobium sp. Copco_Reservoir_LC18]
MQDQAIQWQRCTSTIAPALERTRLLNTLEDAIQLGMGTIENAFRQMIQDLRDPTRVVALATSLKQHTLVILG